MYNKKNARGPYEFNPEPSFYLDLLWRNRRPSQTIWNIFWYIDSYVDFEWGPKVITRWSRGRRRSFLLRCLLSMTWFKPLHAIRKHLYYWFMAKCQPNESYKSNIVYIFTPKIVLAFSSTIYFTSCSLQLIHNWIEHSYPSGEVFSLIIFEKTPIVPLLYREQNTIGKLDTFNGRR